MSDDQTINLVPNVSICMRNGPIRFPTLSHIPEEDHFEEEEEEEEGQIDNLAELGLPPSSDGFFMRNLIKEKPWTFPLAYIWIVPLFWFVL